MAEKLTSSLEEIGISVLHNEAVKLTPDGYPDTKNALTLIGIGPYYPGEGNVEKALVGVADEAPRLIMLHNPELFPRIPAGQAPLAIAGHTHGGQIRIPFLESWSWLSIVKEGDIPMAGSITSARWSHCSLAVTSSICIEGDCFSPRKGCLSARQR